MNQPAAQECLQLADLPQQAVVAVAGDKGTRGAGRVHWLHVLSFRGGVDRQGPGAWEGRPGPVPFSGVDKRVAARTVHAIGGARDGKPVCAGIDAEMSGGFGLE